MGDYPQWGVGMSAVLESQVRERLAEVMDPCSVFNRTHLSITDMGLVRDVRIEQGHVHVSLLLTDPSCLFFFQMGQDIEARLLELDGVESVKVESTSDRWWSEDRMTPEARQRLDAGRERKWQVLRDMRKAMESPAGHTAERS